jgi:hypothetical protein
MQLTEDWHEEEHDKENDTDNWVVLIDLKVLLASDAATESLEVGTYPLHILSHVDTKAESNSVEQIREDLDSGVEPNKTREAEQTNRNRAEREENSKSKTSHDTVSDEHISPTRIHATSSEAATRVTTRAATDKNEATWARSWCVLALELLVVVVVRAEVGRTTSWARSSAPPWGTRVRWAGSSSAATACGAACCSATARAT